VRICIFSSAFSSSMLASQAGIHSASLRIEMTKWSGLAVLRAGSWSDSISL
jgi:hypothetical protein